MRVHRLSCAQWRVKISLLAEKNERSVAYLNFWEIVSVYFGMKAILWIIKYVYFWCIIGRVETFEG